MKRTSQIYRAGEYLPEGVKKMSRKRGIAVLVFSVGLLLAIGPGTAMSVEPSLEQIFDKITTLESEISRMGEMSQEARDIAVTTRLDTGGFKEEVLARLGIWRGKLGQGLILALETRDLAERAMKEAGICSELQDRVNGVNSRMDGLGATMGQLRGRLFELGGVLEQLQGEFDSLKKELVSHEQLAAVVGGILDKEIGGLGSRIDTEVAGLWEEIGSLYSETDYLKGSVEELGVDVSLAKEMAASAKETAASAKEMVLTDMDRLDKEISGLGSRIDTEVAGLQEEIGSLYSKTDYLKGSVEELGADVSLAKEMAASAKIQSDQARKEAQSASAESRRQTQMLMRRVDKLISRIEALEKGVGKSVPIKLKIPSKKKVSALKTYKVGRGETLAKISARRNIYDNPDEWKKIFEMNRDKISDPNLIYPGQILVIPQ